MFGGNSGTNFNNDAFGSFKPTTGQTSIFGSTQNKPFSAFNTASTTSATPFGAPASGASLFGSTAPKIGTTGGLFGSAQNSSTPGSLFGSTQASAPQSSLFGTSVNTLQKPVQSSLFGATVPSGTTIKFDPLKATDTMVKNNESKQINTKHMCITAMKQYESKSLEELRVEDYLANRKVGQQSAGNTLFGAQNTSSITPQGGLFGANASQPSIFQSNSSGFGTAAAQNKPFSAFNPTSTAVTTGTFGAPAASGNLFGNPNVPKLGSNTGGGLFGTPQSGAPTSSLFGTASAPKTSLFGNANTATLQKPAQPSIFGSANVQQQSFSGGASGGNIFGNAVAPKPGGGLFGNAQGTAGAPSIFGSTQQQSTPQASLFGNTAGNPGSGLFGSAQNANNPGSLFGSAQANPPQSSLFGSNASVLQKPAQSSLFGAATQQTNFSGGNASFNNAGSPPIMLGSNVDVASIQHAIIEAQLSSLPYGDSPLLRMTSQSPKEEKLKSPPVTSTGLQRQLRFLSSRLENSGSPSSPTSNSNVTAPSNAIPSSNSMTIVGADLNSSASSGNFSYKPLISLPSVGFGAALGLNSSSRLYSPAGSLVQKTFLSQDRDELNSEHNSFSNQSSVRRAKALDISVVHKSSPSAFSPASATNSNLNTPLANKQDMSDRSFVVVPPLSIDGDGLNLTDSAFSANSDSVGGRSPLVDKTSTSKNSANSLSSSAVVKLSRPEYYCQPTKETIEESYTDGVYNIEAGLTVGRLGYGSVFWRGPLRLTNLDLDNIVNFRSKEIIVYPDETKKPEVGTELNRPAEVSLERVWPVNKDKQIIKDPDELAKLKFSDKLERLCLKMGAIFKDYQPATGTWQFSVPHFSKYGLLDEDEEVVALPTSEELDALDEQRKQQAMLQRAKQPLREIQTLEGMDSPGSISATDRVHGKEFKIPKSESPGAEEFIYGLHDIRLSTKKFKYGSLYEQKPLVYESSSDSQDQFKCPLLKIRYPINVFTGLTDSVLQTSLLPSTGLGMKALSFNARRSCRVGFSHEFIFLAPDQRQFITTIKISKISIVPSIEQYFCKYLEEHGRAADLKAIKKSELLRWNPPSLLLKLLDLFLVDSKEVKNTGIEGEISSACDALLLPASPHRDTLQRVRFGYWLRRQLSKNCEDVQCSELAQANKYFAVYIYLINGNVQKAVEAAQSQRLYNMSLLISLFCFPAAVPMQDKIGQQVQKILQCKKNTTGTDVYYEKILQILSGCQQSNGMEATSDFCLSGLNWMQTLGVIIWYWCRPSSTLLECVRKYEELARSKLIIDKDLYV